MFFSKKRKGSRTKKQNTNLNTTPKSSRQKKNKVVSLNKKRGVKKEERTTAIVLAITMIFFVASVGGSIFSLLTRTQIPTMGVENGAIEVLQIQQGIIIRDETVYTSPFAGELVFVINEHERVHTGGTVATINNTETITYLEEESEDLTRTILALQEQRVNISAYTEDANYINNRTQALTNNSIHTFMGTETAPISSLQEDVNNYILMRNDMLASENRGALEPYVNRSLQNEALISENMARVVATESGIVSHRVDGLEGILTFETMGSLTPEQTRMTINDESISTTNYVNPNDNIFKIVNSNEWFIASYIPNEFINNWAKNSTVTIYIQEEEGFKPMNVIVHDIVKGEEETFVIFKSRNFMTNYINQRNINFKTVDSQHRGLKIRETAITTRTLLPIPVSHVYEVEGNHMVIKREDDLSYRYVHITPRVTNGLEIDENYVYILQDFNNLALGDTIIIQGKPEYTHVISEVVTDTGVFRVNNGIATFTSINTEGMVVGDNGYVILSPEKNSGRGGLNVHDRIISDAINYPIEERQKIF